MSPFDARTEAMSKLMTPAKRKRLLAESSELSRKSEELREAAVTSGKQARELIERAQYDTFDWHEIVRLAFLEGKSIGGGYTDAEAQGMWPHSASAELIDWDAYEASKVPPANQ